MKIKCKDPSILNPPVIEEIIEIPDKELKGLNDYEYQEVMKKHFNNWILNNSRAEYQIIKQKSVL